MANLKFCVDCTHIRYNAISGRLCFKYPTHLDLVSGVQSYGGAAEARLDIGRDTCGTDAKFFEPKPVKVSLWRKLCQR